MTRPRIMGIVNVTPDSFSDGGRYDSVDLAVKHALSLHDQGADILDVGGESTRPGAAQVDAAEEALRVVPVIMALRGEERKRDLTLTLSVDTRKAAVARQAVLAGADIWNDVSALSFDEASPDMAAQLGCDVILMHVRGMPETMQDNPRYQDVLMEVCDYLNARAQIAMAAGVEKHKITLDPGIGFGKTLEHNLALIRHLDDIKALGYPVLMGVSRKSFIDRIDGSKADDRLGGSLAAALYSVSKGADILRVHDVVETVQALAVWSEIHDHS
nr:dihydropteroate synthase [Robiginitomaculum antarcticum]